MLEYTGVEDKVLNSLYAFFVAYTKTEYSDNVAQMERLANFESLGETGLRELNYYRNVTALARFLKMKGLLDLLDPDEVARLAGLQLLSR